MALAPQYPHRILAHGQALEGAGDRDQLPQHGSRRAIVGGNVLVADQWG